MTADPAAASDASFVSLLEGAPPFDSGLINVGSTFSRAFDVAGR